MGTPRVVPLYTYNIHDFKIDDFVALNPQFEMIQGRDNRIQRMTACRLMVSRLNTINDRGYIDIVCRGPNLEPSLHQRHALAIARAHDPCPTGANGYIRIFDTDLVEGQAASIIGSLILKMYIDHCHACGDRTNKCVVRTSSGHNICRECLYTDNFYPPYKIRQNDSDCCFRLGCGGSKRLVYSVSANEVLENIFGETNAIR